MTQSHDTATEAEAREALRAALQGAGLRITGPRLAVLEVLLRGGHLSAERVFAEVRSTLSGTSLQTVYGVLEALCKADLARKIELAGGSAAYYEANKHDNHHHMVCRLCGRVEDTPCDFGVSPCLHPRDTAGFAIETAEITFYGACRACHEAAFDTARPQAAEQSADPHPQPSQLADRQLTDPQPA